MIDWSRCVSSGEQTGYNQGALKLKKWKNSGVEGRRSLSGIVIPTRQESPSSLTISLSDSRLSSSVRSSLSSPLQSSYTQQISFPKRKSLPKSVTFDGNQLLPFPPDNQVDPQALDRRSVDALRDTRSTEPKIDTPSANAHSLQVEGQKAGARSSRPHDDPEAPAPILWRASVELLERPIVDLADAIRSTLSGRQSDRKAIYEMRGTGVETLYLL
jgi:hypothetical protein